MYRADDVNRDQSYFLFGTTQEQLDYLRFPLGEIQKEETIEILKERAAHEMIQSHEKGTIFSIDGKDYLMFRLPFDVTYSEWYGRDTKYGEYR